MVKRVGVAATILAALSILVVGGLLVATNVSGSGDHGLARHGADDPAGDDHGLARRGVDDAPGDDHGLVRRGADNPPGDDHGNDSRLVRRGADDPPGHV